MTSSLMSLSWLHCCCPTGSPSRVQLPWMNGPTVTLDAAGKVNAIYPPPPGIYGEHCKAADHLITVNITSIARNTWTEVRERLDHHVAESHTGFFHEVVFAEMAAAGSMSLEAVVFPSERWYEVDTPADRDAAELLFPRQMGAAGESGAANPKPRDGVSRSASQPPEGPASCSPSLGAAQPVLAGRTARCGARPLFRRPRRLPGRPDSAALGDRLRLERRPHRAGHEGARCRAAGFRRTARLADRHRQLQRGAGAAASERRAFQPLVCPGAFVILATGVIRLSHFNVFGLVDDATYRGLSLDNNVLVLALLFAFEPLIGRALFAAVLYVALMVLAALNVAPIETPKLGGRWYYAVILYALVLSGVYGWQLR